MGFINSSTQLHSTPVILRRRNKDKGFTLRNPVPIAATIDESAFTARHYNSRLFINDVQKPFLSATINAPRRSLGKSLEINLARPQLSEIPDGATFKFEIGQKIEGVWVWATILDGSTVLGKNYSVSFERDSLSFSTVESLSDKLAKSPKINLIVFDGNRTSVSVDEIENLYTNTNEVIGTAARDLRPLTLYKLLTIAFVDGCGFDSVKTNLPNYQVLRCEFSVTQSYTEAVSPFVGMYEPVEMFAVGNVLWVLDTNAPLPAGFVIQTLTANRCTGFNQTSNNPYRNADGIVLRYMTPLGSVFADRDLPDRIETTGEILDDNRTTTTIKRTVREWFEQGRVIDQKIVKEISTTISNDSVFPSAIETEEYTFDRLGNSLGYTKTAQNRMPDISLDGAPDTLTTREETQKIEYSVNPFAPRSIYQSRIVTTVKELLAVDDENKAIDKNGEESAYKQSYAKVFEAGNLKKK